MKALMLTLLAAFGLISTVQGFEPFYDDPWVLLCTSDPSNQPATVTDDPLTVFTQVTATGPNQGDIGQGFYMQGHADFWQKFDIKIKGAWHTRLPDEDNTAMWQYVSIGPFTLGPAPNLQWGSDQTITKTLTAGKLASSTGPYGTFTLVGAKGTFTAIHQPAAGTPAIQVVSQSWTFQVVLQSYALAYQAALAGLPSPVPTGDPPAE
jgi:hypothetical protein